MSIKLLSAALLSVACSVHGAPGPTAPATSQTTAAELRGGWEKLGERVVNGAQDRDVIHVGRAEGVFTTIEVRVDGSALVMEDIRVVFGNGEVFEPKTRLVFSKDTRSRAIDLPGNRRIIKRVEFKYGNLPGGGRAHVELFGREG